MTRAALRWPSTRADWTFSPASAALNIGGALLALAAVGHATHLTPAWSIAAVCASAGGSMLAARGRDLSRLSLTLRALLWAGTGVWLWAALSGSPWRVGMLASLAIGTVAATLSAPALHRRDERLEATAEARAATKERTEEEDGWAARIARVCRITGVTIVGADDWPTPDDDPDLAPGRPGFTLDLQMPKGGHSWEDLASHAARLASDARLPHGCGVEAGPGYDRSRAVLHVALADTLARERARSEEHPLRTCLEPLPIGWHRESSITEILTRESSVLVTGAKGSGKTTLLHGMIAGLCEQVDQLVWLVDLNGGGLARPWLDAWLAGEADRPAVDWAAATVEEAEVLAATALEIVRERKKIYARMRMDTDSSLLPLSADLPQITIVLDEGKAVSGDTAGRDRARLSALLLALQEEGRNEGGNIYRSNLRPTGGALGGVDVRVQSDILIMMQPKAEEISKLFDSARGVRPDDAPWQGTGLLSIHGSHPRAFRAPDMPPQAIRRASIAVSGRRPALDGPSARVAGDAYARRWEADRVAWLLDADGPPSGPDRELAERWARPPAADAESMGAAVARMDATAARLRAEREADEAAASAGGPPEPADTDPDSDALAGILAATTAATGDRRALALALLRDKGAGGSGVTDLHADLVAAIAAGGDESTPTSRQTLDGWMRAAWAARQVWRRPRGVYVHGDHPRPADAEPPPGGDGA